MVNIRKRNRYTSSIDVDSIFVDQNLRGVQLTKYKRWMQKQHEWEQHLAMLITSTINYEKNRDEKCEKLHYDYHQLVIPANTKKYTKGLYINIMVTLNENL